MTLALVHEKNRHAMTLVDPCVVCEKNTHAMTLVDPYVVCEKNTHAMTLVDPYVVCGKEHTCNEHWWIHVRFVERTHMQCHWLIHVVCGK